MTRLTNIVLVLVAVSAAGAMVGCSAIVGSKLDEKGPGTDSGVDSGTPTGCSTDEQCDDGEPCNGSEMCVDSECEDGAGLDEGVTCNTDTFNGRCNDTGVCEGCGDNIINGDEECDDGKNGIYIDGCTDECFYSCHVGDGECGDGFSCNGLETCQASGSLFVCVAGVLPPVMPRLPCMHATEPGGRCWRRDDLMNQFCCVEDGGGVPVDCCTMSVDEATGDFITDCDDAPDPPASM